MSQTDGLVNRAWLAGAVTIISAFVLLGTLLLSLLEAQAAARTARMQAMVAEATTTSRAKDEFLAMLGHELRNPLAPIANAARTPRPRRASERGRQRERATSSSARWRTSRGSSTICSTPGAR